MTGLTDKIAMTSCDLRKTNKDINNIETTTTML